MNYRMIVRTLSITLRIVAVLMLPALIIALCCDENSCSAAFAVTIALMLILSLSTDIFKPRKSTFYAREGFVITALTWIVVSLLGTLPFYLSGSIKSYVDCLFETISGFTTTGASILSDVESLPYSILYWRSFTHWLGGMGVLVFLLAVSTFAGSKGDSMFIMRAESSGPQVSKLVPRTMQTARILYMIYAGMTALQAIALLISGMPVFDAVTLSFATAGTGGFSIKNDSIMSYTAAQQWILTVFMILFGVNFGMYYLIIMRSFKRVAKDEELRLYLLIYFIAVALITVIVLPSMEGTAGDSLRHAFFQVASVFSSTGYATLNYELWPQVCHILLMMLMIIGACAGSTGGGVKCSRFSLLLRSLRVEIDRLLHPNMVRPVKMDGKAVPEDTVRLLHAYFVIYCIVAVLATLLLSLEGFSFETTVSSTITCLNNVGPGFGGVGPVENFGKFSNFGKLLLCFVMLAGRLQFFPLLILLSPRTWTKAPKQKIN